LSTIQIWHNNRCSKSRAAYNYLKEHGYNTEVREYLKEPPTKEELQAVLKKLNSKPSDIIRKKEALFKELNLKDASEDELLDAMVKNPKLIERPIVLHEEKAVIARPLELVEEIL
jgi:arsenate reductase